MISAFDLFSLAVCISGVYDTFSLELPPYLQRGGHFQFLTNISLLSTCIYIISKHILMLPPRQANLIYNTVMNLEFTVTSCYWTLHYILPHWLNTATIDRNFVLDFKIHLWPYLYLLVCKERRNKWGSLGSGVVFAFYWAYIEWLVGSDPTQRFAYPFLNRGGLPARAFWLFGMWLVGTLNYLLLKYIKNI
ncbi:uncharacterized protein LODBEIA_P32720 [Lodderomyces beijingensis]|uniref:Uncharacterized protein n=1 Tax=Lodderomyces beijingensis TaxID=1775926 RepID=A0ABP0ZMZ9_9ASCO